MLAALLIAPVTGNATEQAWAPVFASCAGRYSAELEHAWLMQDDRATQIADHRRHFIDLIDATAPRAQLRDLLNVRIDAKLAHATLLSLATFSKDEDRALWALRRARSELAHCSGMLLKS